MSEEKLSLHQRIKNKIAENSGLVADLRADDVMFKGNIAMALGDAAPTVDMVNADTLVAGVKSLRTQVDDAKVAAADLRTQRRDAYDAEREATKRADALESEKLEIARLYGLIPDEEPDTPPVINEPADAAV